MCVCVWVYNDGDDAKLQCVTDSNNNNNNSKQQRYTTLYQSCFQKYFLIWLTTVLFNEMILRFLFSFLFFVFRFYLATATFVVIRCIACVEITATAGERGGSVGGDGEAGG